MPRLDLFAIAACVAVGCGVPGGNGTNARKDEPLLQAGEQKSIDEKPADTAVSSRGSAPSLALEESPDGEMLPGLIPRRIVSKNAGSGKDGGPDALPEDRTGLLEHAKKAIKTGNFGYALAIIDVLNIMHPDDPEVLELRGNILMEQGQKEDAMADLDKCCSLGRSSCCR